MRRRTRSHYRPIVADGDALVDDRYEDIEHEACRPVGTIRLLRQNESFVARIRGGVGPAIVANGPGVEAREMALVNLEGHRRSGELLVAIVISRTDPGCQRRGALQSPRLLVAPGRIPEG